MGRITFIYSLYLYLFFDTVPHHISSPSVSLLPPSSLSSPYSSSHSLSSPPPFTPHPPPLSLFYSKPRPPLLSHLSHFPFTQVYAQHLMLPVLMQIFGAAVTCRIRISEKFIGTGESFLFMFDEESKLKVYPWTGVNNYVVKGNTDSFSIGSGE